MLALLLACGDFGLAPEVNLVQSATGDTGESPRNGGDDDQAADEDPVSGSVEGNTWAVDLADVNVTEPPGMSSMLALMDSTVLLFHATVEGKKTLELVVTLASPDGSQNPCERVHSLPSADWHNPVFAIDDGTLNITISGEDVAFDNTVLGATIDVDGEGWHDGILTSSIDAREFVAALPEGTDMCELVDAMGGACGGCDDGAKQCFDLVIEDIVAQPARGDFDASPSGC